MVIANDSKSVALAKAIHRSCQPSNKPTANRLSANVAAQPTHGIIEAGKNQLSLATYALKCAKSPHSMPPVPAGPHNPKRSATAERNAAARATRSSKTAMPTSRFFIVFVFLLLGKDKARALGLTRIRLQLAFYFCLHKWKCLRKGCRMASHVLAVIH